MNVIVRRMQGGDLAQVEQVYTSHLGEPMPDSWLSIVARALQDAGEASLAWVAVAEPDPTQVLGYIVGELRSWEFGSRPAGWVIGIGVAPAHQGGGAAALLLARLLKSFRQRGVTVIRTMVQKDDLRVLRFFRGSGFTSGPYTELEIELEGDPQ